MCEERVHVAYVPPELSEPREARDAELLLRWPIDVIRPRFWTKERKVQERANQQGQGSTPQMFRSGWSGRTHGNLFSSGG
jgi:hypothetical protein